MRRREFLAGSVGGLVAGAVTRLAFGGMATGGAASGGTASSGTASGEDDEAARRHDKQRRFAQTTFGRIAYIDRGTGPAALFLHGFPLSSFQWRGAIDWLSAQRRCLAPDSMGLGHTEVAAGQSVTPSAQADMLAAFLDR
ncbi:MAG: alpha/beta hydrolase, partial [Gammaproteobacteria bacterium]|nr:alpha/beta hydrolase [Gammaproteobacteria bacterium]